jgi:hypothetical protein
MTSNLGINFANPVLEVISCSKTSTSPVPVLLVQDHAPVDLPVAAPVTFKDVSLKQFILPFIKSCAQKRPQGKMAQFKKAHS